jgi:anti-anti-sigma regulatory factor
MLNLPDSICTLSFHTGLPSVKAQSFERRLRKTGMPIGLDQGESVCVVRLEGEVKIASAAALRASLLEALASGTDLRLDLDRATEVDVTALQLLWAAQYEARRTGKACTVAGAIPEAVLHAAREAAFEELPVALANK